MSGLFSDRRVAIWRRDGSLIQKVYEPFEKMEPRFENKIVIKKGKDNGTEKSDS